MAASVSVLSSKKLWCVSERNIWKTVLQLQKDKKKQRSNASLVYTNFKKDMFFSNVRKMPCFMFRWTNEQIFKVMLVFKKLCKCQHPAVAMKTQNKYVNWENVLANTKRILPNMKAK